MSRPKGLKHTEETKRKMSEIKRGHRTSIETKNKIRESLIGRKPSRESIEKMRVAHIGKKKSIETRKRMCKAQKGKVFSEETRRRMSEAHKGVPLSKETRRRMGEARKGERSPNWQGGISFYPYPIEWKESLRESIRERDGYTCQLCGDHQDELDRRLHVHHIDYDKDNLNPENLISLCCSCHMKTNHNREDWYDYFS
jgi:hypothetical protein